MSLQRTSTRQHLRRSPPRCPGSRRTGDADAIAALGAAVGPLDGLFNCAGFVHHGTILDVSEEEWAFSFDLYVTAMFRTMKVFLPGMLKRAGETGTASVLNMASVASSI